MFEVFVWGCFSEAVFEGLRTTFLKDFGVNLLKNSKMKKNYPLRLPQTLLVGRNYRSLRRSYCAGAATGAT